MSESKTKKIILSGGGTGGSVAPLLAIYEEMKDDKMYQFFWVGAKEGIEKEMLQNKNIQYFGISNGKLRRYWSWKNIFDLLFIIVGFFQSLIILQKIKPNLIISAGSYISVPLVWAGWILNIPAIIHQQDFKPGLANKLMSPFAKIITVAFEKSLKDYGKKAVWIGNPIRKELIENKVSKREALGKLGLTEEKPVLLVLGGGTGAVALNELIKNNFKDLTNHFQVIHITGKGKSIKHDENRNYLSFEFLDTFGLIKVFSASNIIISRCGMNVLTELSYYGKPAILIPMPDSHQEENAKIFSETKSAIVIDQNKISNEEFVLTIKNLNNDQNMQKELSDNIEKVIKRNAVEQLIKIIKEIK